MRPIRPTIHAPWQRAIASLGVYGLGIALSLLASPTALRAQAVGGSSYAPAIASTGGPSGISSAASAGVSHDNSQHGGLPQAYDRSETAPAAQSPWTADRTLPDAGQLRPRYADSSQTTPVQSATGFPQTDSRFGQADSASGEAIAGQAMRASATAPISGAPGTTAASESPFAQTSAGVQHIPLAPPSKRLTEDQPQASGGTLQMVVSIISSLLLVVGLFLGIAWCYRKTVGTSLAGGLPKQVVNVVGRTSISARQQLVLVRFGSKLLLVSVIQGEARTLGEISDPLEVDQMLGQCESGQPGSISQSFKSLLHSEGV